MFWRLGTPVDLEAIQAIANVIHEGLPERAEVFAEKLRLFPQGCFVLEQGGEISGYAFVHPWHLKEIPKLDEFLSCLPPDPECLLIHDIAILPRARGGGASKSLIKRISILAKAKGLQFLALVSVYGSHLHWARLGFSPFVDDDVARELVSYGQTARYMVCRLNEQAMARSRRSVFEEGNDSV